MAQQQARVLTVGADPVLLGTRVSILSNHYQAIGVSPDHTLECLRESPYDLLLVCSSTPYEQATILIRQAHAEFPHLCIVRLIPPDRPVPPKPVAHAVVTIDYRPENWMKAVHHLLTPGQKASFA